MTPLCRKVCAFVSSELQETLLGETGDSTSSRAMKAPFMKSSSLVLLVQALQLEGGHARHLLGQLSLGGNSLRLDGSLHLHIYSSH